MQLRNSIRRRRRRRRPLLARWSSSMTSTCDLTTPKQQQTQLLADGKSVGNVPVVVAVTFCWLVLRNDLTCGQKKEEIFGTQICIKNNLLRGRL
jgi:hypothetical protein